MNHEINNMDDLFDENINKSLRELGFIFPRTVDDFKRLNGEVGSNIQPERLKDPYSFLGERHLRPIKRNSDGDQVEYTQNLAQAAREGKQISEEIRRKMAEDKLRSSKKKNE